MSLTAQESFVFDITGDHGNIPRDHRPPIVSDAKIHSALQHPNNLFVRMHMRGSMCACLHFPPHDHFLFTRNDTPLNCIVDALPWESHKLAEAGHYRHDISPVVAAPDHRLPTDQIGTLVSGFVGRPISLQRRWDARGQHARCSEPRQPRHLGNLCPKRKGFAVSRNRPNASNEGTACRFIEICSASAPGDRR